MIFGSWKTTMKHDGIKGKAKPANTKLNGIGYVVSDPSETGTGLPVDIKVLLCVITQQRDFNAFRYVF